MSRVHFSTITGSTISVSKEGTKTNNTSRSDVVNNIMDKIDLMYPVSGPNKTTIKSYTTPTKIGTEDGGTYVWDW
jgi:hypothetical protein